MNRIRTRVRAFLVLSAAFWVLPFFGSLPHDCLIPADKNCCGMCGTSSLFSPSLAQAYSGEAAAQTKKPPMSKEAKDALDKLLEGNRRFAVGKPLNKHTSLEWRAQIAKDQKPFATILGCADSRVTPERIFDQGLGDLFVVRVAGNVVDTDVTGSMEYAGLHLGTRLFVVLGHESCGAVSAVVQAAEEKEVKAGLKKLLQRIRPALKGIDPRLPEEKRIAAAVEANVRWSMKQLATNPEHRQSLAEGKVALVGAIYELETGKVRVLD